MSISPRTILLSTVAAWATAFTLNVAAAAPEAGEAPGATDQSPGTAQAPAGVQGEVSDKTLKQFAEVAAEVQKIQQDYAAKAQSLQQNTQQEIISSVQDAGMSVEQFTALVERIQTDPSLADRLDSMQGQGGQ